MQETTVDKDGRVRCPRCGASDFSDKRTVKGKIAMGLMAPKRLKCRGCGTNLQRGGKPFEQSKAGKAENRTSATTAPVDEKLARRALMEQRERESRGK